MKLAVIIALIIGLVIIFFKTTQQPPPPQETNVTALVELVKEKSDGQKLVFNVALDTHSVDLNVFDLSNNIILDKKGKKIKPEQVNISGGIHHKTAEATFNSTPPPFTIIITNLDNISERKFEFNERG